MSFLEAQSLAKLSVAHGFFTREDGASSAEFASRNVKMEIGDTGDNARENRRLCLAELELEDQPLVYAKLSHGNRVYVVEADQKSCEVEDYDAIISAVPNVSIAVSTADCVPILIADAKKRAVAVIHAGWRGLENGVIANTLKELESRYAIPASSLVAAIGPAIHQADYQVGAEVADRFPESFVSRDDTGLYLDLLGITDEQLRLAGVSDIELQSPNTATDKRFYSYRAEDGQTGRQLNMISLTP